MIKVGIVGGTGYTGAELLRILTMHPEVDLQVITSRSEAGIRVNEIYQNLRQHLDLAFTEPDINVLSQCDLVFYATPNGVAMKNVPELLEKGVKVIDLAADFRLRDAQVWEQWYGIPHASESLLEEAVYGLAEINREQIKGARLVANPGCYPTAVQLGFIPLLEAGLIETTQLIADCKSGVSGAGRGAKVANLLCETSESFKAYGVSGHRHLPEIKQGLVKASGNDIGLTFVPHLTPMIRGIHATLYGQLKADTDLHELQTLFESRYRDELFVDVMPLGSHPETRSVKGSNQCRIAIHKPQDANVIVVLSVIDNLVKGAAGQAVQCMNLMFDLEEGLGLQQVGLLP